MARTKASVGAQISSGKISKARCAVASASSGGSSGSSEKSSRGSGGGNPVCPRETPKWQKPITNFFFHQHNDSGEGNEEGEAAGSSNPKPKRNIIYSDDESSPEKPRNNALDETIELEELNGEDSHKVEEYYPKGSKGKGVGKKTKETKYADSKSITEMNRVEKCNGENKVNEEKYTKDSCINEEKEMNNVGDRENFKENIDKENVDSNKENYSNTSSNKSKSKREREDKFEDGNACKKIKL